MKVVVSIRLKHVIDIMTSVAPRHFTGSLRGCRQLYCNFVAFVCVAGPLIYHVEVKESASKRRGEPKVVPPFRIQVPGKGDNKSDHYEQFEDLDEVMARWGRIHVPALYSLLMTSL